eukprot:6476028-Amphidinium_carterae.1
MRSEASLRYLPPSECTSRTQELNCQRKDETFMRLAQGKLREVKQAPELQADLSDVYKARLAFQRRALAMDQYDLLPYRASEDWADFLFNELHLRDPPPGFQRIGLTQLLDIDRQMWTLAAGFLQTKSVARSSDGSYPIQVAIGRARADPFLGVVMQPLPLRAAPAAAASSGTRTAQPPKRPAPPAKESRAQGPVGKKKKHNLAMPEQLRNFSSRTPEGRNICFGYNLPEGCPTSAQDCTRGVHPAPAETVHPEEALLQQVSGQIEGLTGPAALVLGSGSATLAAALSRLRLSVLTVDPAKGSRRFHAVARFDLLIAEHIDYLQ